jgi:hypothetical protein
MTWTLQSIQTLLLDRPGPSLHNTAAATSLTSFINVSRQPKSRKPEQNYFLGKWFMYRENRIFGPIFRVSLRWKAPWWKPPTSVGGERSENGGERSESKNGHLGRVKTLFKEKFLAPQARAQQSRARFSMHISSAQAYTALQQ